MDVLETEDAIHITTQPRTTSPTPLAAGYRRSPSEVVSPYRRSPVPLSGGNDEQVKMLRAQVTTLSSERDELHARVEQFQRERESGQHPHLWSSTPTYAILHPQPPYAITGARNKDIFALLFLGCWARNRGGEGQG